MFVGGIGVFVSVGGTGVSVGVSVGVIGVSVGVGVTITHTLFTQVSLN